MILAYSMLFCDYYHPEFGVGGTHPSNAPFRGTVKSPRVVLVKRSVEAKRDPSPRRRKPRTSTPKAESLWARCRSTGFGELAPRCRPVRSGGSPSAPRPCVLGDAAARVLLGLDVGFLYRFHRLFWLGFGLERKNDRAWERQLRFGKGALCFSRFRF